MSTLVTTNNRIAHAAILESMEGLDTPKNQWMSFMAAIDMYVPPLSTNTAGSPSSDEFEGSLAQELGFKTHLEMLYAPKNINGFGQNEGSWKAKKKAWSVVRQYPYLLKMELTVDAVKKLSTRFAFLEKMPTTVEEYHSAVREESNRKEREKLNNVMHWKGLCAELQSDIKTTVAKLDVYEKLLREQTGELQSKLTQAEKELELKNKEISKISNALSESTVRYDELKRMGRLAHLTKFFTG